MFRSPHGIRGPCQSCGRLSSDETIRVAEGLGVKVFAHNRNYGYGANQKTCYGEALQAGADVIVMVHPDYQYDTTLVPEMIAPISNGAVDVVLDSPLLGVNSMRQGVPRWKHAANRFLTLLEKQTFRPKLSEYHTGYRAFSKDILNDTNFEMNSHGSIPDQEILAQIIELKGNIIEIPAPTSYFPLARSTSFLQSTVYGLSILLLLARFRLHNSRFHRQFTFSKAYGGAMSRTTSGLFTELAPQLRASKP